jgi:hypothetical protein
MKKTITRRHLLQGAVVSGTIAGVASPVLAKAPGKTPGLTPEERAAVDVALGKKGNYVEAQATYTVPLPRADLKVRVQGEAVPTALGFGGWVSVKKTLDGQGAVLMSDTVLLQEEVNPLIDAVQANGLEVSAIHNHFFYEEPRIFYMHVHGMGSVADVANRYAKAIRATKLFPANQPSATPPAKTGKEIFDVPALDAIVKYTGTVNGSTYKYTIGRDDLTVMAMGAEMTAAIGLNTWLSLAGTADNAIGAGDVAMLEHEVNPVVRVLRHNKMEVVAMHHHMLGEQPRIIFLHYYGKGPAVQLATAFRSVLDIIGKPVVRDARKMRHVR